MKNLLLGASILCTALAVQAQKLPGTADSSFNLNGFKKAPFGEKSADLSSGYLDAGGKPVLVGSSMNVQFKWSIGMTRLNTNGSVDNSFKNNGIGIIDLDPAKTESVTSSFLSSSGNLWCAGLTSGVNGTDMMLIKADQDGTLDVNFANSGFFIMEVDPGYEIATHVIEDKNGKVVVLGNAPIGLKKLFMLRLNSDGTIDSSFSTDGLLFLDPLGENNVPVALMERPQGGYYVVANTSGNGSTKISVVSVSQNGNTNIDLGGPGEIQFQYQNMDTRAADACYHNGSIFIAGDFDGPNGNTDGFVTRLETDGTINTSFNQTGYRLILKTLANTTDEYVTNMIIAEDSSIFVTSISYLDSNMLIISRLKPDGNVEATFGSLNGHHHVYLPEGGYPDFEVGELLLDEAGQRLYILGGPNDGNNDFVYAYCVYTGKFAGSGNTAISHMRAKTLSIYPNPAQNVVTFDVSEDQAEIEIYTLQGQLIAKHYNTNSMELSGYQNGTYLVLAYTKEGIHTGRLQIVK